jgi:hypothetical protein
MEKGRLLEPRSPSGQNARSRVQIEGKTGGETLVSARHRLPAIPIAPLQRPPIPIAPLQASK